MLKASSSEKDIPANPLAKTICYQFAGFEFNNHDNSLSSGGKPIALAPKPSQFLGLLLAHSGQIVSNKQLISHIWGESVVDYQQNLHYTAKMVRKALSDEANAPQFIETIPRTGYRFIGTVNTGKHRQKTKTNKPIFFSMTLAMLVILFCVFYFSFRTDPLLEDRKWLNASHLLSQQNSESWQQGLILTAQLVDQYPQSAKVHALHAKALFSNQKAASLIETAIADAIALDPDEASAWRESGLWKLYQLQQPQLAQTDLERSLRLDTKDTAVLYNLGLALFINGDLSNAIKHLEQALKLDPVSAQIHGDLGWYYLESGQIEKAKSECAYTLTLQQNSYRAHQCLLDVALLQFDQKTAMRHGLEIVSILGGTETEQDTIREQWRVIQEKAFYEWYISFLNKKDIGWHSLQLAKAYIKIGNNTEAFNVIRAVKQSKHPVFMLMQQVQEFTALIEKI